MYLEPREDVPCCDLCEPALFDHSRPGKRPAESKKKSLVQGVLNRKAKMTLDDWRDMIWERDWSNSHFDSTGILGDNFVAMLASLDPRAVTAENLKSLLKPWVWWTRYGDELTMLLKNLPITFTPKPKKPRKVTLGKAAPPGAGVFSATAHPAVLSSFSDMSNAIYTSEAGPSNKRTATATVDREPKRSRTEVRISIRSFGIDFTHLI